MLQTSLNQRVAGLPFQTTLAHTLIALAASDAARLQQYPHLALLFAALHQAFGIDARSALTTFSNAWMVMYAAISRLDELQDDDTTDTPLPVTGPAGLQYNLVLALYILGASLLDELVGLVPERRLLRLCRFWNDTLMRMADGQHADLAAANSTTHSFSLDEYQQTAQAKTGATFALAFGGAAMLLSDEEQVVTSFTHVGEIYGTLIQYSDDIHDAKEQPDVPLTLPNVLAAHPQLGTYHNSQQTLAAFWSFTYTHYRCSALEVLHALPASLHTPIATLFTQVFEDSPP